MTKKEYNTAVKSYSGRLYGYVLKYLKNAEDARDIVQEVFMKLWLNRKKVPLEKAKSWLFISAHNALINTAKKNSRTVSMGNTVYPEPYVTLNRFELQELIEKCLEKLPPVQKSIILLRDMEGYNYKEIGEILELNESQVKVYLFRGRQKIKNQLKALNVLSS